MRYQWKGRISKLKSYLLLTFLSGGISWPRIQEANFQWEPSFGAFIDPSPWSIILIFYLILSFPLINWKLFNASTKQSPCGNWHSDFWVFTTWTFDTLAKPLTNFWCRCRGLYFSYLVAIHFQFVSTNSSLVFILQFLIIIFLLPSFSSIICTIVLVFLYVRRTTIEDLAPLNPKMKATCRHKNAARKRREQEIQGSSQPSPPPSL